MSVKHTYNSKFYNFCGEVEKIFNIPQGELENLHELRSDLMPADRLNFDNETRTDFHSVFYGALNSDKGASIKAVYEAFIRTIIAPKFNKSFMYQAFPSFIVHITNDQAMHKWQHDSDENHNHPDWEINFQVALTKMWDSNAMWLESVPGLGDFKPVEMEVGEYTIFYGNKCAHGNKENKTGKTRVSMDFRVLPYDKYDESSAKSSATAGTKFVLGHYYNLYECKGSTCIAH